MADPAEFQKTARDAAQLVHAAAMTRLATVAAQPDLDPDLALKLVRETKDIAQALPKDKADAYANLPVFHIHFGPRGSVSAEVVADAIEVSQGDAPMLPLPDSMTQGTQPAPQAPPPETDPPLDNDLADLDAALAGLLDEGSAP